MTPDSTCGPSQDRGREDPWPIHRSRSPRRSSSRSRADGRQSSPKRKVVERRRCPAPSPESRSPSPPRVIQVVRERRNSSPDRGPPRREISPRWRIRTPPRMESPPRWRSPPRESSPRRLRTAPRLSSPNTCPIAPRRNKNLWQG